MRLLLLLGLAVATLVLGMLRAGQGPLASPAIGRGEAHRSPPAVPGLELAAEPAPAARARGRGAWRAPLAGRLVDERTREPLPYLRVALGSGRRVLETDGEGRLRSAEPIPAGTITAELGRAPVPWRVRLDHHAQVYDRPWPARPVPAGPTYRLLADLPVVGKDARLYSLVDPTAPSLAGVVRAGERHPWVRFAPLPAALADAGPWGLVVLDGRRLVEGEVASAVGAAHPPVALRVHDLAALRVSLFDEQGQAPIGAELEVVALDGPTRARPAARRPVEGGVALLGGLRPGRYAVTPRCGGYYRVRQVVQLEPATTVELPLVLEPIRATGRLEVTLGSASGNHHGPTEVLLTPLRLDDPDQAWGTVSASVEWVQRAGDWIGTCAFTGLPEGSYELTPRGGRFHCWAPATARARPGTGPMTLRLLDRGDEADLVLRVFDGATGAWVDGYSLELTGRGCGKHFSFGRAVRQDRRAAPDRPALSGVPPQVEVRWCVTREGYLDRCGGLEAFGEPERIDGRLVRVANVHLDPR